MPGGAAIARLARTPAPGRATGLRIRRSGKRVVVSWRAVRGAKLYILRLIVGGVSYAPDVISTPRFVSTKTLPHLRPGAVATITVTALAPTGIEGSPGSTRYRAPNK